VQSSFAAQALPHAPQFCGSIASSGQPPSHGLGQPPEAEELVDEPDEEVVEELPQSVGAMHWLGPHWPVASQVCVKEPCAGANGGAQ
jgi:hypothetical protein